MFILSDAWRTTYPGAAPGTLAICNVANPEHHAELERHKEELESQLRTRFAGSNRPSLLALLPLQADDVYVSRFKLAVNSRR